MPDMILSLLSPIVSATALAMSLFTLWFTILRRGTVRSTHPALIAVRYDFVNKSVPQAQVFLRALLFSTGKRGALWRAFSCESMGEIARSIYSFWGYRGRDLVRETTVRPRNGANERLLSEIRFATLVGRDGRKAAGSACGIVLRQDPEVVGGD